MIGRRRFLSIVAGAGLGLAVRPVLSAPVPQHRWTGVALGAPAQIVLAHENAPELVARAQAEILRLERIFSLYRSDSALSRLNEAGHLPDPPADLLALLAMCGAVHRMTAGAFDPTIQPLWRLYAERYSSGAEPTPDEIKTVLQSTGWDRLHFRPEEIAFRGAGGALSLNGIAQGFIADKVAQLLRAAGLRDVLIDMGEIVALGRQPDGAPWPIAVRDRDGRKFAPHRHAAANIAVATSAPLGTVFDAAGTVGHILDPRTGRPAAVLHQVTVTGPSAALADGLSTGLCLISDSESRNIPPEYAITRI